MSSDTPVHGRPFTRADLEDVPDDGHRYEIIDGTLIVSAAPSRLHQRAIKRLVRRLDDACPADMEVLMAPFAVGLANDTEMQPDVVVGREADFTDRDLAIPVLVVEVLSPSSRTFDLYVKRGRFERAGTPSYWLVDPAANPHQAMLWVWDLDRDGRYRETAQVTGDKAFVAEKPFPVTVVPADLVR